MATNDGVERGVALLRQCRAAFAWWERWSSGCAGTWVLFLWAVAEATVWPILPDFLLVPMAVGNRRRYLIPLLAAMLGMALGGTVLYLFAYTYPQDAARLLGHLPTVRRPAIDHARGALVRHGLLAFLYQPWSGVPFKVWALLAGSERRSPLLAIPLFIVARGLRMAILATIARQLAVLLVRFVRDFFLFLVLIYLVLFFYGWWQLVG